jgi:hypothetical protein
MDRGLVLLLIIGGAAYYYWQKKEDSESYRAVVKTVREEVVERNKYGQKLVVNTYEGSGESEELVKRSVYKDRVDDFRDVYNDELLSKGFSSDISNQPLEVYYFGDYKIDLKIDNGNQLSRYAHGVIKIEKFDLSTGEVSETIDLTEMNGEEINYVIPESYKLTKGIVNYTLIP